MQRLIGVDRIAKRIQRHINRLCGAVHIQLQPRGFAGTVPGGGHRVPHVIGDRLPGNDLQCVVGKMMNEMRFDFAAGLENHIKAAIAVGVVHLRENRHRLAEPWLDPDAPGEGSRPIERICRLNFDECLAVEIEGVSKSAGGPCRLAMNGCGPIGVNRILRHKPAGLVELEVHEKTTGHRGRMIDLARPFPISFRCVGGAASSCIRPPTSRWREARRSSSAC